MIDERPIINLDEHPIGIRLISNNMEYSINNDLNYKHKIVFRGVDCRNTKLCVAPIAANCFEIFPEEIYQIKPKPKGGNQT